MANLNKVMIIGNLTRNPEIRYTPKGTAVAEIGIAVNRTWTDNGTKKEEVTFVGVTLWGHLAELAGKYLVKGRSVYIEGRLSQEIWEDKETGKKQTKTKVVAEAMQFIGGNGGNGESKGEANAAPRNQEPRQSPRVPSAPTESAEADEFDDLPF